MLSLVGDFGIWMSVAVILEDLKCRICISGSAVEGDISPGSRNDSRHWTIERRGGRGEGGSVKARRERWRGKRRREAEGREEGTRLQDSYSERQQFK